MSRAARIAIAALAVAVVAIVILVVVLVEHVGESESTASKRVTPDSIKQFDTIVVLVGSPSGFTVSRIEDRMNRLNAVDAYAELSHGALAYLLSAGRVPDARTLFSTTCAAPGTRAYVVSLARPASASRPRLTAELDGDATVLPVSYEKPLPELFMTVRATQHETQAVEAELKNDPDVVKFQFLDHIDAYNEFKRLFADQPQLIQSEPADGSGLPESFRLDLRDGASPETVAARYRDLPGVDTVNVPTGNGVPDSTSFDICKGR